MPVVRWSPRWLWWCVLAVLVIIPSQTPSAAEIPKNLTTLLSREYSLTRTPKPGETAYYRITRVALTMDSSGAVTSRSKSTGLFSRTVLLVGPDGVGTDRYTWKAFTTGRTEGAADSVQQREVAAIRGFSYDLSSSEVGSLPPIRTGGLAKTVETFAFFVVAWDAAAFDLPVTPSPSFPFHRVKKIGDHAADVRDRAPADFDFTPVVSKFTYTLRRLTATFASLSLVGNTPCAVVRFQTTDNPLAFDFLTENMVVHLNGIQSVSGTTSLSLVDGTVARGELHSLVVASQTATLSSRPQPVQSPAVMRQHVVLERITKAEFER